MQSKFRGAGQAYRQNSDLRIEVHVGISFSIKIEGTIQYNNLVNIVAIIASQKNHKPTLQYTQ